MNFSYSRSAITAVMAVGLLGQSGAWGATQESTRGSRTATPIPLQRRWVGWKVMIYNIESDTAVKMEAWVDDRADNT